MNDSNTRAGSPEAERNFELRPPPQVVLWLGRNGSVLDTEAELANGCCSEFNFRPGVSAHRAIHPHCADSACTLLTVLADGLRRIDDERILEWELPADVMGMHVRLHMRRARGQGETYATLAIIDITEGRKLTTTLRDANLSLSNLVEKSEVDRTRQINQLDRKLRTLSGELILAQEEERHRIATDLHDSVGQWLSLSKLSLETALARLKEGEAQKEVSRAFDYVRTSIKEVRAIVSNLRPSMLEEFGLVATVELLCQELQLSAPAIEVSCEVDDTRARLSVPQCVAMVRILQEALHNIAKHSNATVVSVTARILPDSATLTVRDNGRGFDTGAARTGVGLTSMRERAQRSGGKLRITSTEGGGTVLTTTWQLEGNVDKLVESGTYKAIRYGVGSDRSGIP